MEGGSRAVYLTFTDVNELTDLFLDQYRNKASSANQNLYHIPDTKKSSECFTEYYVISSQLCHDLTLTDKALWAIIYFMFPQVPGFADRKRD